MKLALIELSFLYFLLIVRIISVLPPSSALSPFAIFVLRPELSILLRPAHLLLPFLEVRLLFNLLIVDDELVELFLDLLKILPVLFLDCDLLPVPPVDALAFLPAPFLAVHLYKRIIMPAVIDEHKNRLDMIFFVYCIEESVVICQLIVVERSFDLSYRLLAKLDIFETFLADARLLLIAEVLFILLLLFPPVMDIQLLFFDMEAHDHLDPQNGPLVFQQFVDDCAE